MFKCVICEHRKGKRYCPLKDAMICSQCCGLVQTEGNCPTDCPFLRESKVFASEKQDEREDQLGERFKRHFSAENEEAMQTFNAVSKPLNDLFVERAEKDEFLEDKDLVEALDDLIKDLAAGVGQVVRPEDVKLNRAGALLPLLKQALEALHPEPPELPVPGHLIKPCLEILRGLVSLSAKDDDSKAYLHQLLEQKEAAKAQEEEEVVPAGQPVTVDVSEAQATSEAAQEAPSASDLFEEEPDDVKNEG